MVSLGLVGVLVVFVAPERSDVSASAPVAPASAAQQGGFAQVQGIVSQRCAMCHNAGLANKNVRLDTPELIAKNAQALYQQAVVAKTMPLNNATQITEAERAALGRWVQGGAKLE